MKKKLTLVALAAMAIVALGSATGLVYTVRAVKQYEKKNNVNVLFPKQGQPACKPKCNETKTNCIKHVAQDCEDIITIAIRFGVSPSKIRELNGFTTDHAIKPGDTVLIPQEVTTAMSSPTNRVGGASSSTKNASTSPSPMKVANVSYDGNTELEVFLSERPDMENARRYVEVSPLKEGTFSLRYRAYGNKPRLIVTGDFAHRTNVTLRIRKGLPIYGGAASDPAGERSLSEDFVHVFQRKDLAPRVAFADKGRYLPPMGNRAIAVESVNVSKIHTEVRRVEPRNVVQMLAREEDVYSRHNNYDWREGSQGADTEDTGELAGESVVKSVECANRLNEKSTTPIPVTAEDGGPTNGIYLVTIRDGGRPREFRYYWDDKGKENPNRYRVVCLTDLGISVRNIGDETGVWVTSLKTGSPVQNCRIEAFSTANIKVAIGNTDADGWCILKRTAKGDPFVVVAHTMDDMSFIALRTSMKVDETHEEGDRPEYLGDEDCAAFLWTERGIYRHDEKIFMHGILRNGKNVAPKPFPVEVTLTSPANRLFASKTLMPDANGAFFCETFSVPADQASGDWTLRVKTPGNDGKTLGWAEVCVEEFAPPQIRVKVDIPTNTTPQTFCFNISAEHLFGGPASSLACEGAVVFEDVPFAPKGWEQFKFGNDDRGLSPCFRRLDATVLDESGKATLAAPIWKDAGLPKAAVRAIGQGVVFEDGGRPATARAKTTCHYYPFYIGATLSGWMKLPESGCPEIAIACVSPDGRRLAESKTLKATIERIDTIHAYRETSNGWHTWDSERVRNIVVENVEITTSQDRDTKFTLPLREGGEYVLTLTDADSQSSFARTFYLNSSNESGDDEVRTSLGDPTKISITPDKSFYRVGETPRLMVKSPFTGFALLSVMRDHIVYTQVLEFTNATSFVSLPPVAKAWAPSVDVALSVVQSVAENARHLAVRAHGETVLEIRPLENETTVRLDAKVETGQPDGGSLVTVDIDARGAAATGTVAVVTVVDEGINLLTDEPTPDPVAHLARQRCTEHPLYDLYGKILPVLGDDVRKSGVKTGGGFGAEMLGRVSPVPTRRFKPLALWKSAVPLTNGTGRAAFSLPEFAGEVRVTAVAYSDCATGASSIRRKVSPKIVMQPDAPRFAAPGDKFVVTLPLHNRSGAPADVEWKIGDKNGTARLADGASTNICLALSAPTSPGQMKIPFRVIGCGETHEETLELPIRPAAPWRETCGTVRLAPGEKRAFEVPGAFSRQAATVHGSPIGELVAALEWLAAYPHGCLEQTSSRIFPLITAGGMLNAVGSVAAAKRAEYVAAGVKRVSSMIRQNDFVMWPDCNYAPWDKEVSLYAAHFLIEAEKSGQKLDPTARGQTLKFLKKWAMSTNTVISAYACHTLALAGLPEKDRMLRLYDVAKGLAPISRARLSRAFALAGDPARADALLSTLHEPSTVKEAAFSTLAILERNPSDERLPQLIGYLATKRDPATFNWGTTESNAHALLAIGAYYRHHPPKLGTPRVRIVADGQPPRVLGNRQSAKTESGGMSAENIGDGDAFVSWRTQVLPSAESVTNEANGISITREFLKSDMLPADMDRLVRGELLVVKLTIESDAKRELADLVIEDLFAGAFEPVHREIAPDGWRKSGGANWVMRSDARDDRMLIFSKKFKLEANGKAEFYYPLRVVSAGDFVLPGPSVEAMYAPSLHARCAASRVAVGR